MITFYFGICNLVFIFVLQGIWLFIAELAGKRFRLLYHHQILIVLCAYNCSSCIALSVLLASIMTFGSFAENYEFCYEIFWYFSQRAMKMLTITIGILSLYRFFANNVIPDAQFRFINLRKNIVQQNQQWLLPKDNSIPLALQSIKVDKNQAIMVSFRRGYHAR